LKRIILVFFILWAVTVVSFGQDFKQMLKEADALVNFPESDFSAEYTIVHDSPGKSRNTTVSAVFRRDREEMYVIIVLKPEVNKGQGYLKKGNTLWFYDPEGRRFNSSSSKDRFQNSNARNSDFTRSTLAEDYSVNGSRKATLGRFDCWQLDLKANSDEVTYPVMKIWISEGGLVRKTEGYSLSGQLLRTTAIPVYNKIGDRYIPKSILFIDALKGAIVNGKFVHEKTQITINKPSLDPIEDSVFSKSFLESVGR